MLVVLAKSTSVKSVGDFGLAVAICTPITIFAGLSLSGVQVTDARNEYQFGHYLAVRLISAAVSVTSIAVIVVLSGYSSSTKSLIFLVGLGQAVLIIREVFLTFMQKQERMDLTAGSNVVQGLLSLIAFGLLVRLTGSLLAGVIGLLAVRVLTCVGWDVRCVSHLVGRCRLGDAWAFMRPSWQWSRLWRLVWLAAPLGLTAGLISLNGNVPRYFIERIWGTEALGYFVAVMALPTAGVVIIQAAGASASPRLAKYFVHDRPAFRPLLLKLVASAGLLGLSGVLIVAVAGGTILGLVFRPAYVAYNYLFLWLMVQASLSYIASFLGYGLIATRRFANLLVLFASVTATTILTAWCLVPWLGLKGGAFALMAGTLLQLAGSTILLNRAMRQPPVLTRGEA
jgi:O-antigen/teichoic acid export membrane protein